ncbi:MAG: ribonuclease H-like domain-containing protein [Acidobacteriota bacterium]|jgi:hypothetical protein
MTTPFDKLSRVAALRPRTGQPAAPDRDRVEGGCARLARLLDADLRRTPRGKHLSVIQRFSSPEACVVGPSAARLLAPHESSEVRDPLQWLFLDTETTGLSGGTGTYAFLVGLGWWEGSSFVVEQFFMRDHSEEASLLLDLSQRLSERRILVTFNGKSFDWPLLETRFRMTRVAAAASPAAHLDLLHPSRQLWRFRLKSVALAELEREVLQLDRGPDIPSHTIPGRYFEFLRGGAEEPIAEVFQHNQMDLRGLAALAVKIVTLFDTSQSGSCEGGELYGVSRMWHRRGEEVLAREGYERALTVGLPEEADRVARRELALLARRQGDFASANALWETLLDDQAAGIQACEQLAIHYEHRTREPERALALTRAAVVRLRENHLSGHLDLSQFQRRHARLARRLDRLQARVR